jgi:TolB-like protein
MTCGRQPFNAATTPELFSSILRDPAGPFPGHVSAELRLVIARCLEKAPERRYQNARDVRSALENIPLRRVRNRRIRSLAAILITGIAALIVILNWSGLRDRLTRILPDKTPITLAVLPLDNQTGDPEQDYLGEGLTERMITVFSRMRSPRLTVIPRAESMLYKRSPKPLDQIGRELMATTILKGSITRAGDHIRLFAELVQTSNAHRLWTESYERTIKELPVIEDDVSQAVLKTVGIQMAEPEKKRLAANQKLNSEAYDLYLRGVSHAVLNDEQDLDQAIALLEKSAAIDPTFVPTHAYLALTYGNKSSTYRPNEPQWEEKGFAAVQKALALDPDAPEAHYAQAMMLWRPSHGFPSREALAELRKALVAQPNFDEAWHQHAVILFHVGHLDGAAHEIQRSLEINPGNTVARFRFGPIYVYQQKFDDALAALDRVPRESFPAQWSYQKAWSLISLGRLDDAGRFLDAALMENPADQGGVLHSARAMLRAKHGDRNGAEADVAEAIRVGKNFIHFHHTAYSIAAVYASLGEFDKAQDWIKNAADQGFPNYTFFENDVHLAGLRSTPGFQAFLSKLRKEWEHIPGEPE